MAPTIMEKKIQSEILARSHERTRKGERFCRVYVEEVQKVARERGIDPSDAMRELYRHTFRRNAKRR